MTSYHCPVCGVNDEYAYMRCYRPDCTDGRDTAVRDAAHRADARANFPFDQTEAVTRHLEAALEKLARYEKKYGPLDVED